MKNKFSALLKKIEENSKIEYKENSKILIVDGLNLFLRCFCIINQINPSGNHIGGLTGSLKSLGYAIKLIQPTKVIITFDGQASSASKKNLYPGYKANRTTGRITNYTLFNDRAEENEAMNNQIHRLIQYLQCLPISLMCIDGLEADDIMGYLVTKYEADKDCDQITLMSADQDFLQLTTEKTQVYSPTKKKVYQVAQVLEEYKVHPNNFIIMKTLMGDKSDNVPGINGLGPKKLQKLFPELIKEEIFSFENIFDKSKVEKHLLYSSINEFENQLKINYKLMNLKEHCISHENQRIIEDTVPFKLNKRIFLQTYYADLLGDSIPRVEGWIDDCFLDLNYWLK